MSHSFWVLAVCLDYLGLERLGWRLYAWRGRVLIPTQPLMSGPLSRHQQLHQSSEWVARTRRGIQSAQVFNFYNVLKVTPSSSWEGRVGSIVPWIVYSAWLIENAWLDSHIWRQIFVQNSIDWIARTGLDTDRVKRKNKLRTQHDIMRFGLERDFGAIFSRWMSVIFIDGGENMITPNDLLSLCKLWILFMAKKIPFFL